MFLTMGRCLPSSSSGIFLTIFLIFCMKFFLVKDFSRIILLLCGDLRAVEKELVTVLECLLGLFVYTGVVLKLL